MPAKKNLIGQKFGKLTVIKETNKRIDGKIVWKCKCDCGNTFYTNTSRLTSGNTRSCGCLSKTSPKIKIGDKFNMLTVIEPILDKPHYFKCQCECGNYTEVYEYNLKKGEVKSCGCLRRQPSTKRLDLTNQKFGKLTALYINEALSNNGRVYWTCQCECGNIVNILCSNLTRTDRFPSCGCDTRSRGELTIENLLKENNIQYVREKTFDNCRNPLTNRLLRFDFYVDNKYLIEFDGEQHFSNKKGEWEKRDSLEERQYRDNIKNQWCKENNIPLIRIPYTKLNNLTIEDLKLPKPAQPTV